MTQQPQSVQNQFGNVAANYRTSVVHATGIELDMMVEYAKLTGNERVLDVGCGAGHTALKFASFVQEVVAYDLTPEMLVQVNQLAQDNDMSNIRTQEGNVEQMPFSDNSFDVVVSRYSAHHWAHPQIALQEIRRVLQPDGMFILCDIVSLDDFTYDTFFQTIELLRDPSHVRDHSAKQWLTLLTEVSFNSDVVLEKTMTLQFQRWVERMATPPEQIAMLRRLFELAPTHVQAEFAVSPDSLANPDFSFEIPLVVIVSKIV